MTTAGMSDVAWADAVPDDLIAALSALGADSVSSARDARRLGSVRVLVTTARIGVQPELLAELPALEAVASYGAGFDNVDLTELARRGIALSTTPDVLTAAVADCALALALDVLRGISEADRFVRAGRWESGAFPLRRQVSGSRVGVFGLGRIGRAIARRFEGFDCEIGYHSRRTVPEVDYAYYATLNELAEASDVLVVAAPGGASTRGAVDADVLRALGPEGVVVNIARGSVVDEAALVAALTDRTIAGAGLDVFADEPRVPPALLDLDHVVLTPHLGSATVETRRQMTESVVANVDSWLAEGRLVTPLPLS